MRVELAPDAARWIEAEVASGAVPNPEAAVQEAVDRLRLASLRAKLEEAVAEGGRNTSEEALAFVRERLRNRGALPDCG